LSTPVNSKFSAKTVKGGLQNKAGAIRRPSQPIDYSLEGAVKDVLADEEQKAGAAETIDDSQKGETDAPLIRLVNSLISEAVKRNASDIHIEPFENLLRVRFRIDGHLHEIQKLPFKLAPCIVARLKVMASLDICEKRMPQDGLIRFKVNGVSADVRLSSLPSVFGEKIVMRVLGTTNLNNDLSKIGIPDDQLAIIRRAISKPDGLVLVTGPTGSGKTTTLYAALNELNDISVSVFTAEDPVEGTIMGVTQSQANNSVGFTFASILRSLLRQDPDVILVGEIRDQETAEICIKASLTGHMVLSTLHTNCAVSTISRLVDIGIAPYLITSSVNCIVAQRLARRVCPKCKETQPIPEEMLATLGSAARFLEGGMLAHGKGCPDCGGTGYKGRVPIYEMLEMSEELKRYILRGASKSEMKQVARKTGMITLREAGLRMVKEGLTTLEEILGLTNEDEAYCPPIEAAGSQTQPRSSAAEARVKFMPQPNSTQIEETDMELPQLDLDSESAEVLLAAPCAAQSDNSVQSSDENQAHIPVASEAGAGDLPKVSAARWKSLKSNGDTRLT